MPDSTLANLTAATAATGGLFYGTQSSADKKFTLTAAGAALLEAANAAAQITALGAVASGGALGTPSSGTLTNCTGLPTNGLVDDAVTLAKMAAGTAGNLISYDASGNPVAVATGTAGQVLTSNGTGLAPTMQTVSGGGGLTNITETLLTASPNNTVNAERLAVTNGTTNVDLVLVPKGTGAFIIGPAPDNTATGGNKRGTGAVDLMLTRNSLIQVASAADSALLGGQYNKAQGAASAVVGSYNCTTSGTYSFIGGANSSSSAGYSSAVIGGGGNSTSGDSSVALGGNSSLPYLANMVARGAGQYAAQTISAILTGKTTDATPLILTAGRTGLNERFSVTSGKHIAGIVQVTGVKSDGTLVAYYIRQVVIKNVSGTTSLVGSVNTIGTDTAAGTSIAITADDTNDALAISVTGITSETWRWVASFEGLNIAYGA